MPSPTRWTGLSFGDDMQYGTCIFDEMPDIDYDEIELQFKKWATVGDKTSLVDADMIPYIVGYTSSADEYNDDLLDFEIEHGEYDKTNPKHLELMLTRANTADACDQADSVLNQWVEYGFGEKTDSALFFLTQSPLQYRMDLAFTVVYKGTRTKPKPPFFYEIRHYIKTRHKSNVIVAYNEEADDLMCIMQHQRLKEMAEEADLSIDDPMLEKFAATCIISKDKDLKIIQGKHVQPPTKAKDKPKCYWVNTLGELEPKFKPHEVTQYEQQPLFSKRPVSREQCILNSDGLYEYQGTPQDSFIRGARKGEGKFKRVSLGKVQTERMHELKGSGLKFFYAQMLIGDKVDNYKGLEGCGAVRAYELLNKCKSEKELWLAVLGEYKKVYGDGWHTAYMTEYQDIDGKHTEVKIAQRQMKAIDRMMEQGRLAMMQHFPNQIWREGKNRIIRRSDAEWLPLNTQ